MGTTADKLQNILDSKNAIKTAIEDKGVPDVGDVLSEYANKIASIQTGGSGWTGHADVEGLKAIGWDDEDIAYYQEHGVNWNEEDDPYHLVPEDNKALYGIININNLKDYRGILVYMPKIDTTGVTNMGGMFQYCQSLIAIPILDTSKVTDMRLMFGYCSSLICIPPMDMSLVTDMRSMFMLCYSLTYIPPIYAPKAVTMGSMLRSVYSIVAINIVSDNKVSNFDQMLYQAASLSSLSLDMKHATSSSDMLLGASLLRYLNIKNLNINLVVSGTSLLEKSSLLYMIENATPTETIVITLSAYCYEKYSEDPDVVAALEKQPLVTLASV